MKLDSIRDVLSEVKGKVDNLPGDAVSKKVPLYKDSFDKIGSILNKEQNIGTKDASYKQYFPLNQSWVRASVALNEADDSGDTSINKLSSIYENYFNELSKDLEKFGVGVSGAVIGGAIGQTVLPPNFKEISIDDVLAEAEADEKAKNSKLPSKSVETQISTSAKTPNNFQEISIDDVLGEEDEDKKVKGSEVSSERGAAKQPVTSKAPDKIQEPVTSSVMHDFGDRKGSVSAHRHKNADGTEGGWVADTAKVDHDVYVARAAQVSGKAQVLKGSRIMHNAKVSGNAVISETGVYNNSQVFGNAVLTKSTLRGNAKVYDEASVANSILCGTAKISEKMEVVNKTIVGGLLGNKELSPEQRDTINLKLHDAARNGNIAIIEHCLQQGADVNVKRNNGWTPLHLAAYWNNNVDAIRLLKGLGADVNAKDDYGWSPLHVAAYCNRVDAIRLLKELGADVNVKNNDGWTPLHVAASWKHVDSRRVLKELGAIE